MITSVEEKITPEKAREYLSKIDPTIKNRPINKRYVDLYARDMKAGKWRVTHQGIAFDKDGYLRDGQHRLTAIIKADMPVTMMVSRGLYENSFIGMDSGLKRNARDVLALSGNYAENTAIRNDRIIACLRALVSCSYKEKYIISPDCIAFLYYKMENELTFIYNKIISTRIYANAHMMAAGLSAILCGEDRNDIINYFSCFSKSDVSGCEDKNLNAVFSWQKQILDLRAKRVRMSGDKLYSGTQNSIWNFCRGTEVKQIKTMQNDRYPVKDLITEYLEEFNRGQETAV